MDKSGDYPFIGKTRPTIYPFNLNAGGHGAPRFQDGKLVAKRQWRNLSNCEKTPYQVSMGVQLLEDNKRLMDAKMQRRSESKEYRRRANALFHPWGSGSGNPNYTRPFCKSNDSFLQKLNGDDCQSILKSDFGGGGEPIKRDDGEKDTRRKVFSIVLGNLKLTVFDKGPFVNIEPTGVKISDKTHFPAPLDGRRIQRRRKKDADNYHILSQPDMAAWMSRLKTQVVELQYRKIIAADHHVIHRKQTHRHQTSSDSDTASLRVRKNDVSHPELYGSYRTILPLKDYPKVPLKLIHGEGKGKIWKFNESSALFKSLVEN